MKTTVMSSRSDRRNASRDDDDEATVGAIKVPVLLQLNCSKTSRPGKDWTITHSCVCFFVV